MIRLNPEVEEAWKRFKEEAEKRGGEHAADPNFQGYTDRDPISETWETKGKIVRLDDVIMAMHLMAARHTFRGLSSVKLAILVKLAELIGPFLVSWGVKRLAQAIGRGAVAFLASKIAGTVEESAMQLKIESSIRTASFSVRADLFREPLKANPKRIRKTKQVWSRHA